MTTKKRRCRCCGRRIRVMCETHYCGSLCREGKCGHPTRRAS